MSFTAEHLLHALQRQFHEAGQNEAAKAVSALRAGLERSVAFGGAVLLPVQVADLRGLGDALDALERWLSAQAPTLPAYDELDELQGYLLAAAELARRVAHLDAGREHDRSHSAWR